VDPTRTSAPSTSSAARWRRLMTTTSSPLTASATSPPRTCTHERTHASGPLRAQLIFLFVSCVRVVCVCVCVSITAVACSSSSPTRARVVAWRRPSRATGRSLPRFSSAVSFIFLTRTCVRVRVRSQLADEYMAWCVSSCCNELAPWPRTGPTSLYAFLPPTHRARSPRSPRSHLCFVGERPVRRSSMRPSALCVRRAPTTFSSSLPMARWVLFSPKPPPGPDVERACRVPCAVPCPVCR